MSQKPIVYGQFYNGLSGLGKLEQNKWVTLENCDVHSDSGLIMPQYSMESESTTPNEACFSAIVPNGDIYAVSKESGKIWKRTTATTWSLAHTNADTSGHRGSRYFNGYLWYWTATKLNYFDLSSTWSDDTAHYATGTNFRGSCEANNTLLLGNGRTVARVDSTNTFSADEFPLPAQFTVTELINVGDDVLIGTYVSGDVAYCKVFLWDTVSTGWSYEDELFEIGVNCFLRLDNIVVAQCGASGRFYYWSGSQMIYFGKIKGITTAIGDQMTTVYNGRPLFANGTQIYSIHKEDSGLPFAFCGDYTCTGNVASLIVQGQTLLASVGTGFDKRGTSFATAVIETPEAQRQVTDVKVGYDSYPEGVGIETKIQGGDYVAQTEIIEPNDREVGFDGGLGTNSVCQAKITLTPSGENRPKIKYIKFI